MKPTYEELEAKCAALAAKINVIKELMEVAEQINKLAQEETEKLAHERNMLAAENAGLKEACGGDGSYRDCPACAHSEYIEAPETPATDAFLAEVRAQGVEMFGQYHNFSEKLFIQKEAQKFAAQIRKGVRS